MYIKIISKENQYQYDTNAYEYPLRIMKTNIKQAFLFSRFTKKLLSNSI